ncbi:response regulator transcription factor [Proteobacteria bacterium 005FR1]|nr:response regulator transcription factor [Proteobacteria bacterium 005FR1]
MDCSGCIVIVLRNLHENIRSSYTEALRAKGYRLVYVTVGQNPVKTIEKHTPVTVIFQYDYPDLFGLADLRLTKQLAPSVPLLMVTQAHSEQLAVWAFRTRVWDYFVQPVDTARLVAVVDTLHGFGKGSHTARSFPQLKNTIPPEARLRCGGGSEEQSILERALSYLDANLHKKIVQADVAHSFGLSTFQFSRLFKRLTRVTFQEYLISRRIEEAKRLLENPKASVTDVCFTVGFQDLSYFTRVFQRYVGLPPSRYRTNPDGKSQTSRRPASIETEQVSTSYSKAFVGEKPSPEL